MKNKILLLFAIISVCLSTNAQIKIDFNNAVYTNDNYHTSGYTPYVVNLESRTKTSDISFNDNKVTIKIGIGKDDAESEQIKGTWYAAYISDISKATEESKLVCDGIYPKMKEDTYGVSGSGYGETKKQTAIDVTISGLSVGEHTIQAFHNYTFNDTDKLPTIGVKVNNELRQTGIVQTLRATTKHESATSYVKFNIQSEGDDVKITYFSEQTGDQYTTTRFLINAIEIDAGTSVGLSAWNPFPEDKDYHVDAENESVELTWTAAEGATSHIVYFGENEETVNNATGGVSRSETSIIKTGLSPLKRYYWRVDEVIGGVTYKGDVWSFQPRRDAFPGAEGFGRYAIGGRGYEGNEGKVYHVTSLDDDATNPQPGTFRYGILKETGPRTIVFDVSGVIHLKDRLTCSDPYVTIAGQTAPGNGIMFRGAPLGVASDGITRFVRLRRGDIVEDGTTITITLEKTDDNGNKVKYDKVVPADCGKGLDGMGMAGNDHSIIDHCSIGWTVDEAFSSRNAKNITLQHTLISEALNIAGHPNYDAGTGHGYAATVGGDKGSLHHNLLAHNAGRNWSMGGGLDKAGYYKDYLDMFNNVCYNWVDRTTDGGVHVGKFVNNYYKMGPASKKMQLILAHLEKVGEGTQQYYVKGNIRENYGGSIISQSATLSPKGESGDEAIYTMRNDKGSSYTADAFFDSESWEHYFDSWANIETAKAAFKNVLSDVGCNYAGLDNHDVRMVSETLKGKTSTTGSVGEKPGIIDATTDTGCEGFDGLNIETDTRPANWDTDKDGIPAWFEGAKGWSDAAANNNADSDGDYYTDLEEYLNWVAVPHFYNMADDGTVSGVSAGTIDLSTYFAGYTSPSYSAAIEGNNGASASVNGSTLTYDFASCTEKLVTINVTASEGGISLTRSFNFFIDASDVEEPEDPTVTPEGTPYTLSTETYKSSSSDSSTEIKTYYFTPKDLTFTVVNSQKDYSAGFENGVKYSAGVQYTIGIPTGVKVDYITFRGYDNYSDTDSYIGELNGTPYGATDYVFPQKDANGNYTVAEHTIQLASPATGSLTFTPQGKQVVWVITLYTSEAAANLADWENIAETKSATVEETGTIKWVMSSGTKENAVYTDINSAGFSSDEILLGANVTCTGTMTASSYTETKFKPSASMEEQDENAIDFTVKLNDGYTFVPKEVEFVASRGGTDTGTLSVKFYDGKEYTDLDDFQPGRYNRDEAFTHKSYEVSKGELSGTFGMRFFIKNVKDKDYGLCNIIIHGTLKYESTIVATVTLDEMATVHDLPAAENVTVKMKRGLTAGAWNTFCVPFDLTKEQLQTALNGSEVEIVEYTSQEGTMLYFTNTDKIVAGTPYLIKPKSFSRTYSDNMTPITFSGVDIVEARNVRTNSGTVQTRVSPEGADYSFVGTYVRYVLRTDGTEYGLNSSNKLIRPSSSNIMRGLRAFFRIAGGSNSNAKVVIGGELTSIDEIDATANRATGVYHVSGHYVREDWDNGKGLPRGLYIVNGRKMVRK